jgi:multidrug efflux pump subunit AcrA (membrane-fusion protein)
MMKSNRWIWLAIAALALAAGCEKKEEEKPKPVVAVKVAKAETGDVKLVVKAPATVWPREQAAVAARVTAPIREIRVRKGDDVRAGQVLAVLENRDVAAQRQEAQAAVADAEANLQKTMAGTLPTDVERARGQLQTAEAALNQAQQIHARRSELFKAGAIPGRDLLQSETDLATAKSNYGVSKKALELLQRQSGEGDIAIARSRVAQAKARLAQSQAQLQFTELRSPFAGTITDQMQYPGDMAQPGSPTFQVMNLSIVEARAQVPESQLSGVKPGQACEFVPADASLAPAGGRITVVNRAVDPARRTVEVWCEIANTSRRLRGNMFGDVTVNTGFARGVVVPQAALQFAEGTTNGTVMVVDDKKIAHRREVETAGVVDGRVPILKGVNPGETVIVEGGYALPDGTEVTVGK